MPAAIRCLLLLLLLLPGARAAAEHGDDALAAEVLADGQCVDRLHVEVCALAGTLDREALDAFADDAERATAALRALLGDALDPAGGRGVRLQYLLHPEAGMSHASHDGRPRLFITPGRVRGCDAPYIHEAVHALVMWSRWQAWLSEGLAEALAARVAATVGGSFEPMDPRGLAAAAPLRRSRVGRAVLPLVGARGDRERVREQHHALFWRIEHRRRRWGAPFYTLSWSFVDFLLDRVGLDGLQRIAAADGREPAVSRATGRSLAQWRAEWLRQLAGAGRRAR